VATPSELTLASPPVVRLIFPTDYFRCGHPKGTPTNKVVLFEGAAGNAIEFGFFYSRGDFLLCTLLGCPHQEVATAAADLDKTLAHVGLGAARAPSMPLTPK